VHDLYDDWARLREVQESGCVLVRPDAHVAWRSNDLPSDCGGELARVIEAILGRPREAAAPQRPPDLASIAAVE
jgi:2,4-dichlorophenol 6-monooxygenase